MDLTLFWSIFVALGVSYFAVGLYASRNVFTENEYFLANRQFGITAVTFTLIATQLGAGMVLGTSQEAYRVGTYGLLYNLGICIGFSLLGFGFASKLRQFNVATTAELFEKQYSSLVLRKIASILSVLTLGGILAGQILASRQILATFTTEYNWVITCFWLLIITYTTFGGLKAVVATDIFQVIVIILIFGTIAFIAYGSDSSINLADIPSLQRSHFSVHATDWHRLFSLLAMPILFSLIEQDLAQRFFSARTKRTAVVAAFLAAFFIMIFSLVPLYFGYRAKVDGLLVMAGSSPLIAGVQAWVGDVGLAFVVCGLIAAIGSTADSLLCAIGSNIVYDFGLAPEKTTSNALAMIISRSVTLFVGLGALITAYYFDDVLDVLTQSYELSVSALFVPLFACYFLKTARRQAALYAVIAGFIGFFLFRMIHLPMPRELATLILATLAYLIGHFMPKNAEID